MRIGILLTKATDKKKVTNLIESLYPFQIQTNLIRLGPKGDGGYLVPNDLDGIEGDENTPASNDSTEGEDNDTDESNEDTEA